MATREGQRLVKAASRGDATAQLTLGRLYLEGGEGLGANTSAALRWLVLARKGGRVEAANEIAEHIPPPPFNSDDIARDYVAACREAATGSGSAAMWASFRLGEVHASGGDLAAAIDCFRRAAEAGHAAAARRLGELLVAGAGRADDEAARAWLEEAAARGDVNAVTPLADLLWLRNDPAAEPWLRQLARAGDVEAMARLAELLLRTATPPPESVREAQQWLVQAARRDHPRALLLLGRLHVRWLRDEGLNLDPRKVPHSPQKAAEYLERAATQNVAEAHWCLAQIYSHAGFARRDLRRARQHLEAAAHAGISAAQVDLARRLMARDVDLEACLRAGHWLCAAMNDPRERKEAETLLDGLADRAPNWPPEVLATQTRLLPLLAESHPRLAVRMTLSARFGLTTRETLFLDLTRVDQGWCLLADVHQYFHYKPWRLVRIVSGEQRQALRDAVESTLPSFRGEDEIFPNAVGSTRARARRLESLLGPMGIDPGLFIADWKSPA